MEQQIPRSAKASAAERHTLMAAFRGMTKKTVLLGSSRTEFLNRLGVETPLLKRFSRTAFLLKTLLSL
jgi:hypothetical protein